MLCAWAVLPRCTGAGAGGDSSQDAMVPPVRCTTPQAGVLLPTHGRGHTHTHTGGAAAASAGAPLVVHVLSFSATKSSFLTSCRLLGLR